MSVLRRLFLAGLLLCSTSAVAGAEEPSPKYENLQVLRADISRDELSDMMLDNLRGLGLPRRQSQGCLHCHVGDKERPSATWDWASDAKPEKLKARAMMAMVQEINGTHLAKLTSRVDPPVRVTCYSCHKGRTDPRPLHHVLEEAYRGGGIETAIATYRELREKYYEGDVYDFRFDVLSGVSFDLAKRGAFDDAIALAKLNAEVHADKPWARHPVLQIRLGQAYEERGIEAVLAEFGAMAEAEKMDWGVLDGFGWGLYRKDHEGDAILVFRRNLQQFPDEYIPNESLGDALWIHGERETGIRMFEEWLEKHPNHEMARRRLVTLRSQD